MFANKTIANCTLDTWANDYNSSFIGRRPLPALVHATCILTSISSALVYISEILSWTNATHLARTCNLVSLLKNTIPRYPPTRSYIGLHFGELQSLSFVVYYTRMATKMKKKTPRL